MRVHHVQKRTDGERKKVYILQGRFLWSGTREEYEKGAQIFVPEINKTLGLHWKIWAFDDAKMEATGIYLYEDKKSALDAEKGIYENKKNNIYPPHMGGITIRLWDVQADLSKACKAPL
jgi:hypothetical protein